MTASICFALDAARLVDLLDRHLAAGELHVTVLGDRAGQGPAMPILMVSAALAMETDPNRAKETAALTAILLKLCIDSSLNQ